MEDRVHHKVSTTYQTYSVLENFTFKLKQGRNEVLAFKNQVEKNEMMRKEVASLEYLIQNPVWLPRLSLKHT